jgi:hypothetical protein
MDYYFEILYYNSVIFLHIFMIGFVKMDSLLNHKFKNLFL